MSKPNKWYLKKGNFEKYEENPFIEKAIATIKANSAQKKQYLQGNKAVQQVVMSDSGEILGQAVFAKFVEVDEDKFAKIYLAELGLLWDMKKPALKVFSFVISSLTPNSDLFYFSKTKAMKYTGYQTVTAVNNAISQLLSLGIIARSVEDGWYFINPMFVFNGNRVTFAKTYVKKKKENPNQTSLLDQPGVMDEEDNS